MIWAGIYSLNFDFEKISETTLWDHLKVQINRRLRTPYHGQGTMGRQWKASLHCTPMSTAKIGKDLANNDLVLPHPHNTFYTVYEIALSFQVVYITVLQYTFIFFIRRRMIHLDL